ncbi:MAG: hypothetical protein GY789_17285 [Hyphomicrobiales bacterium]|nr:hypothetical protein [Hyphomicrobiales bacterium]
MRNSIRNLSLAITLPLLFAFGTATAQISFHQPSIRGLPEGDFEFLLEAETKLYTSDTPEIGMTESWLNDENGDHGTAEILDIFEWQDLPCRKIQHILHIVGEKDMRTVTVDRCQVESGEWKIRP